MPAEEIIYYMEETVVLVKFRESNRINLKIRFDIYSITTNDKLIIKYKKHIIR